MEKKILFGRPCVKRGGVWYAMPKRVTLVDKIAAQSSGIKTNWPVQFNYGDNRLIVNQRV
jgi:hypothetical protein